MSSVAEASTCEACEHCTPSQVCMKHCATCNDEAATVTRTCACAHCQQTWSEPMPYHQRVSQCPLHHSSMAVCGAAVHLCKQCNDDDHKVERRGGFGF